jgi:hypothetical protein
MNEQNSERQTNETDALSTKKCEECASRRTGLTHSWGTGMPLSQRQDIVKHRDGPDDSVAFDGEPLGLVHGVHDTAFR